MAKKTEPDKEEPKTPSLNRIIAQINKDAEETVIGRIGDMKNVVGERIPSGVPALDEAVGGGFPLGRMVEFYGLPSSGKSLIAQLIVAQAQKQGKECVYVDCESGFDPEFAEKLGVDTKKLVLVQTGIGEDVIDVVAKVLKAKPGVIVIDSVGAMITREEVSESVEKVFMAPKARLMSKGLPKLTALNEGTLIIFINQLRKIITSWGGGGSTTTGGTALGFYASIRLEIRKDKDLLYKDDKKSGEVVGQIIQCYVTKNKTAAPFRLASFKFYYDNCRVE